MEKPLPSDINAERATLGSIFLDRDAIIAVAPWLQPEHFYLERHAWIYEAQLACYNRRTPPDLINVADELRRRDRLETIGGPASLVELSNSVPTAVHVEYYGHIVERTALLRQLIQAGGKIAALGYDESEDIESVLDKAESELFSIAQRRVGDGFVHISSVVDEIFQQITHVQERGGEVVGLPSGFRDLDSLTGGLQRSDLVVLAARPAAGKSSLALSLAYNVALHQHAPVGFFALEMGREQLVQRILATHTGLDMQRLRTGAVRDHELQVIMDAMGMLSSLPLFIDDTPGLSIMDVRSKARRLQAEAGLDLLIIDYLQLMSGRRSDNRVQEISEISRGLKALARELNIPVIALSQLSRAVESRQSHVPMLSDLRESGCLSGDSQVYLPDAGRYTRIDRLVGRSGFNVLALNTETWQLESRPVLNAFATGYKSVYRLSTRLGRSIRATANHAFLTLDGWQRLDRLQPGMRLALPRRLPGPQQRAIGAAEPAVQAAPGNAGSALELSAQQLGAARAARLAPAAQAAVPPGAPENDVCWDEVASIELDGETEVYDLTVEGLHNFVADDIVVHNSIEQDADIVMFIYREELYDPNTDKKGIAEIHLAKHRNGPIGVVPLRFFNHTTRFADLERFRQPEGY